MKATRVCSFDGCEEPHKAKGWCRYHYERVLLTGAPDGHIPRKSAGTCEVEGCGKRMHGHGFCQNHYRRWKRGNDPHVPPVLRGPESPRWVPKESLDYDAMHERIKEQRGKARLFSCITCGCQAQEWAYQHTDPEPRVSEHGCLFTDDVMAYEPMCRRCHRAYDAEMRELQQRRETA